MNAIYSILVVTEYIDIKKIDIVFMFAIMHIIASLGNGNSIYIML